MLPDSVKIHPDQHTAVAFSAARIARIITATLEVNQRFSIALSGGITPRPVYELFLRDYASDLPWDRIHLFWGDERSVAPDDLRSNYGMIRKLLIDHIAIPEANIHRIEAELEPTIAAERYESHIRTFFDGEQETFDLTLLGIGTDGHMASLYPGEPTVTETTRWVVPGAAPDELQRITLTAPALLTSANIMFIVTGKNKAPALQQVLQGSYNPEKYPAQLIAQSDHPHTIWVVDSDAASMLG